MDVAVKAGAKAQAAVVPVTEIKKVGVIGAGQMGNGIAHVWRSPASTWCSTTSGEAIDQAWPPSTGTWRAR